MGLRGSSVSLAVFRLYAYQGSFEIPVDELYLDCLCPSELGKGVMWCGIAVCWDRRGTFGHRYGLPCGLWCCSTLLLIYTTFYHILFTCFWEGRAVAKVDEVFSFYLAGPSSLY